MNMEQQNFNIHVEFLLEEPSMENFLRVILPQILPNRYKLDKNCFLRPHNGKSDLKKSIPKKVKVFSNFYIPTKIIIVHDQDSADCLKLKKDIENLCKQNIDAPCPTLIRIPCRELENWYIGDMNAIQKVYPKFKAKYYKSRAKFRNPDNCFGTDELIKIIPEFQKGFASKNIPKHMDLNTNRSTSFNHLLSGIRKFL